MIYTGKFGFKERREGGRKGEKEKGMKDWRTGCRRKTEFPTVDASSNQRQCSVITLKVGWHPGGSSQELGKSQVLGYGGWGVEGKPEETPV